MYHLAYGRQFAHSTAYITSISTFTPSSTTCPVGVQFPPRKRGGSALRSSTTTYCGMLLWSKEHRSSMTMYIPSIDQLPRWGLWVLAVSFTSPAQPLNLCMICEETSTTNSPGFVAFSISLFIPAGLGSQPLGGGKHPIGWGGYDLGLGEEEFGSG